MGHIPILFNVSLWHGIYYGTEFKASQLFHCDWEDINSLNVFINISDIDENCGPLTMINADVSRQIRKDLNYYQGPHDYRIQDEVVNKYVIPEKHYKIVGNKGTIHFVDTCQCFHYGSRIAQNKIRKMLALRYLSPAAFNLAPNFVKNQPFKHLLVNKTLNDYQKLLLSI